MVEADEIVTTLMDNQGSRRRKFSTNSFSDVHHLLGGIVRQDLQANSTAQGLRAGIEAKYRNVAA